ncbi:unnamed protein product [Moneuplotes crassus]|uniref:Uncharacterized protein n=1 Tax=Euplotes crassus TaxID=5936 RepID=A0AAD1U2A6_EUPCR|nr:unnamed protein product [Moneuplotes crassus]
MEVDLGSQQKQKESLQESIKQFEIFQKEKDLLKWDTSKRSQERYRKKRKMMKKPVINHKVINSPFSELQDIPQKETNSTFRRENIRNIHFSKFNQESIKNSDKFSKYMRSKFGLGNLRQKALQDVQQIREGMRENHGNVGLSLHQNSPSLHTKKASFKRTLENFGHRSNSIGICDQQANNISIFNSPKKRENITDTMASSNQFFSTRSLSLFQESYASNKKISVPKSLKKSSKFRERRNKLAKIPAKLLKKLEIKAKMRNLQNSLVNSTGAMTYNSNFKLQQSVIISQTPKKKEFPLLSNTNSIENMQIPDLCNLKPQNSPLKLTSKISQNPISKLPKNPEISTYKLSTYITSEPTPKLKFPSYLSVDVMSKFVSKLLRNKDLPQFAHRVPK